MGFSPKHEIARVHTPLFQPYQIVCLEHESNHLYAEVVQTVEHRQICWVRPLALVLERSNSWEHSSESSEDFHCYDLRQGPDLLWPLSLFRAALDTEVLPLLTSLHSADSDRESAPCSLARQQLEQFVQQVWQACPEAFSKKPWGTCRSF